MTGFLLGMSILSKSEPLKFIEGSTHFQSFTLILLGFYYFLFTYLLFFTIQIEEAYEEPLLNTPS